MAVHMCAYFQNATI